MSIVDGLLEVLHTIDPGWRFKYNQANLHITKDGRPGRFLRLRPRKEDVLLILRAPKSSEFSTLIDDAGFDTLSYLHAYGVIIRESDLEERRASIRRLMQQASEVEAASDTE